VLGTYALKPVLDYVAGRHERGETLAIWLARHAKEPASPRLHDQPFLMGAPHDLRRAVLANRLVQHRDYWQFADYADIWINSLRQRGIRRCLEWALIGARKAQPAGASISR
jgi:hypothetical protein